MPAEYDPCPPGRLPFSWYRAATFAASCWKAAVVGVGVVASPPVGSDTDPADGAPLEVNFWYAAAPFKREEGTPENEEFSFPPIWVLDP